MNDIISIFNRLTERKLADCNLFEDILSYHYNKFRFFYYIVEECNLKEVYDIICKTYEKEIVFNICIDTRLINKLYDEIRYNLNNFNDSFFTDNYLINFSIDSDCIIIKIECEMDEMEICEKCS